ncbi:MAG: hypothetical protein IKZ96_02775 [Bacilli bacterium]|nr:hypothetical protein [Bacilli bacterium]
MNKQPIKFKKQATITTPDGCYVLERSRFFIMPHRGRKRYKHRFGNICTISKLDDTKSKILLDDINVVSEIYSFDDNRLRFLMDTYKDAKVFDTEMHDNGKELPITVIEKYDDKKQSIRSLDVLKFESDMDPKEDSLATVTYFDIKILRLINKTLAGKSNKKDL